jgi:two-component system, OmpR family, response regulator MprA
VSATTGKILIAEDDRAVREAVSRALRLEGYEVTAVADGAAALEHLRSTEAADLVILDVSMPSVDGITVARVLRSEGIRMPVLMLTARSTTSDRVAGLDAGADDYLTKPFDLDELFARVRALLRRVAFDSPPGEEHRVLSLADLRIDTAARRVWRAEREIDLSKTEYDLLEYMVRNQGIVLDHTQIYEQIWNYDFGPDSKNLTVYMGYLRRKTEEQGEPRLLHTVRGVGYIAREDDGISHGDTSQR